MDAINAWEIEIFILWKVHAKDFYSRLEAICCVPLWSVIIRVSDLTNDVFFVNSFSMYEINIFQEWEK